MRIDKTCYYTLGPTYPDSYEIDELMIKRNPGPGRAFINEENLNIKEYEKIEYLFIDYISVVDHIRTQCPEKSA